MRRNTLGLLLVLIASVAATSCGTIRSVSAILDADKARADALKRIEVTFQDSRLLQKDRFGNQNLSKESVTFVAKKENRDPLYFFYLADAYLAKARDLQSKSEHERAVEMADKAKEFADKAVVALNTVQLPGPGEEDSSLTAPVAAPSSLPKPMPAPKPVAAPKPAPKPASAPKSAAPAPKPAVVPATNLEQPKPMPMPAPAPAKIEDKKEDKKKEEEKKEEPAEDPKKKKKEENYYDLYERLKKDAEEKNKAGTGGAK